MPTYLIRRFDRRRRALDLRFLDCVDDDEALQQVALMKHAGTIELFEGERSVWRFEARRGAD